MTVTRFAPSPTGILHLGHAYAASVAFDLAQQNHGTMLLRFEDIDHSRTRPEYYQQLLDDLAWLGFSWQPNPWKQATRLPAYQDALAQLQSLKLIYPCSCTRQEVQNEVARLAHAPHGPEGPLYPGTCRNLTSPPKDPNPAWRLNSQKAQDLVGPLTFHDSRLGTFQVDPTLLGDVVLARKDLGTSYHLAVVVDDAAQKVTHVTRGEDLLPSTHVHRLLQTLLNLPEPKYLHHPLVVDKSGKRLAKRHPALTIQSLRQKKLTPTEILTLAQTSLASAFPL